MKFKRTVGLVAALGLVWSAAHAQDTPPAQETTPAQETPAQTPTETPAAEPAPARKGPLTITYDIGAQSWGVTGNEHKFRQYATPPRFGLGQLRIEPTDLGGPIFGILDLRSPFDADWLAYGKASFFYGATYLSAFTRRNQYFDPVPNVIDESDRHVSEISARQLLGRSASVSYQYRADQQDWNTNFTPFDLHQRTYINNVALEGEVLGGYGSLSYTDFKYFDRTDVRPDSEAKVSQAVFGKELTPGFSLTGSLSRTDVTPGNGDMNRVDTASIGGGLSLGDTTELTGMVSREWWDLPTVQSAKLHERNLARVNLLSRFAPGWTGQLGFRSVQIERERFDHSWIDAPRWNTFEAKLNGRLGPAVRVSLKGFTQSVRGYAASTINGDPDPLYWTYRNGLTARAETGNEVWTAYGSLGLFKNRISNREVEVRYRNITLGGTYQLLPNLAIYAEHQSDQAAADSSHDGGPALDSFFPDSRTDVVGLSWMATENLSATLDYTDLTTNNDNPFFDEQGNIRGRYLTATLRFKTKPGIDIDLTFAPWHYEDVIYDAWGYDAKVFGISARGKF